MNSFVTLVVGMVAIGGFMVFVMVPAQDNMQSFQANVTNVEGTTFEPSPTNATNISIGSSGKLYSDPLGWLFDWLNPTHFESDPTVSPGDFVGELLGKVLTIGGIIFGVLASVAGSGGGISAAAFIVTFQTLLIKLWTDISNPIKEIPVIGLFIVVLGVIIILAITVTIQATMLAGAGLAE